jgi:hypothetical protein
VATRTGIITQDWHHYKVGPLPGQFPQRIASHLSLRKRATFDEKGGLWFTSSLGAFESVGVFDTA